MQFLRGGGGGGGAGAGSMAWEVLRRHFSRKRAVDIRRINPKVPKEEAVAISGRLLQILADHGPLTVGNTWNHAKVPYSLAHAAARHLSCMCASTSLPLELDVVCCVLSWLVTAVIRTCQTDRRKQVIQLDIRLFFLL
jgi:hypothetical protein